jgi:serine/threonine protein kinase
VVTEQSTWFAKEDEPFIAPEVLQGKELTPSCDVWSVGILVHVLLTGVFPSVDSLPSLTSDTFLSPVTSEMLTSSDPHALEDWGTLASNPTLLTSLYKNSHCVSMRRDLLSTDAAEFLELCLSVDPKGRGTMATLQLHPFVTS